MKRCLVMTMLAFSAVAIAAETTVSYQVTDESTISRVQTIVDTMTRAEVLEFQEIATAKIAEAQGIIELETRAMQAIKNQMNNRLAVMTSRFQSDISEKEENIEEQLLIIDENETKFADCDVAIAYMDEQEIVAGY